MMMMTIIIIIIGNSSETGMREAVSLYPRRKAKISGVGTLER